MLHVQLVKNDPRERPERPKSLLSADRQVKVSQLVGGLLGVDLGALRQSRTRRLQFVASTPITKEN